MICTRPLPTKPKFAPEATANLSSKKGEKASEWWAKEGVLTLNTGDFTWAILLIRAHETSRASGPVDELYIVLNRGLSMLPVIAVLRFPRSPLPCYMRSSREVNWTRLNVTNL